jgi:hypothetical protein
MFRAGDEKILKWQVMTELARQITAEQFPALAPQRLSPDPSET